jgi:hypothetical protein
VLDLEISYNGAVTSTVSVGALLVLASFGELYNFVIGVQQAQLDNTVGSRIQPKVIEKKVKGGCILALTIVASVTYMVWICVLFVFFLLFIFVSSLNDKPCRDSDAATTLGFYLIWHLLCLAYGGFVIIGRVIMYIVNATCSDVRGMRQPLLDPTAQVYGNGFNNTEYHHSYATVTRDSKGGDAPPQAVPVAVTWEPAVDDVRGIKEGKE